ncbi:MAG: Type II secretory pathway, ATPase PulE/Tfp pilus assembly pathway, ATPase PilB [Parcubacteria group bacterium GW2011_GWC2_45_7]|nr:MAG: Type II secretory pathway, ATPase PulE/Tfp pilus assembly pathway, ATPase PilB [Parcubacteria group bacterium GW2011_GWC2_45_7]
MNKQGPAVTASREKKKSFGEILVEQNLISETELNQALKTQHRQGGKLGEILVHAGSITADDLARNLSIYLSIPFVDVKRHTVDARALRLIPEEMARNHVLLPLDVVEGTLIVVMSDPQDIRTIKDIEAQCGMRVDVALGISTEIQQAYCLGITVLKWFPADLLGGPKMLSVLDGPFGHYGIKFIPTGGINENNFVDYLKLTNVQAVGGSFIIPEKILTQNNLSETIQHVRYVVKLARGSK